MTHWISSLLFGLELFDAATGQITQTSIRNSCFGVQVGKKRTFAFTFPEHMRMRELEPHGKIVSFVFKNNEVLDLVTECEGINNGTHQIFIHDNKLYVQETYVQRIKTFLLDDNEHVIMESEEIIYPFGKDILYSHYILQKPYATKYFLERHDLYRHMNAMTIQDDFIYILSPFIGRANSKPKQPTIAVFHLDFRPYAEIALPTSSIPHDLVFIGSDVVYVNSDHQMIHFNIFTQTVTKSFKLKETDEEKWQRGLSYDGVNYIVGCGQTVQVLNTKGEITRIHPFPSYPCFITNTERQHEYNNCLSDVRKSYVKTLYKCPPDLALYNLCFQDLYDMFTQDQLNFSNSEKLYFKDMYEYYNTIYFASSVNQIINPNENIFRGHKCVQICLNHQKSIDRLHTRILKKHGHRLYNTLGNHIVTGRFFVYPPQHGMGWHHNINNSHLTNADRWYMVRSNDDSFGASFFLYRHPLTHLIHFVPDVNNTIKHFELSFDEQAPLWHAVVSFRAIRVSFGVSTTRL